MAGAPAPKVSVVTVYHDGANFLAEAAESVLAQTLGDWEYLLVDDGSTDAGPAIAASFAARDARVRCLAQPDGVNRGQAAARGLGAQAARGAYLLFLDHDDVLYPPALATLGAALDAHPAAAMAWGGVRYWAYDPAVAAPEGALRYRRLAGWTLPGRPVLWNLMLSDDRHPANCSTMIRRADWLAAYAAGAVYPGMYEETAMLFRLLARAPVHFVGEVLSAYRMHAGSFSHRAAAAGTFDPLHGGADRARFLRWVRGNVRLDPLSRAVLALALRSGGG
jgi:glycosyltransferase involved in cell wall biosynthesis